MGRPNVGTGEGCFQIYNVGTGRNYSINDVAKLVAGTEDIENVSVNVPLRRSELLETKADIQKFSNDAFVAGWSPRHRLEDVINSY
jgi:nucleoside-diphosphate-sugar epimerase